MQPERKIVNAIIKHIKEIGGYHIKIADKFTSGIPDIIAIIHGKIVFMEVKTKDGDVKNIQNYTIFMLQKHGAHAFIVRSLEDAKKSLALLINK